MSPDSRVVIVGAGVFGVSAAVSFRSRGFDVTLVDPGPLPHPLASSTDISKAVRMDYGTDDFYMDLMEEAFPRWEAWNRGWGEDLYRRDGFLLMSRDGFIPGGFESESFDRLTSRGYAVDRLDREALGRRYPEWNAAGYTEGYFNPHGGWADSGAVVTRLLGDAERAGVRLREGTAMRQLVQNDAGVAGIETVDGETIGADCVVVAAGVWTPVLLPHLSDVMWVVGQPVLHFKPERPERFAAPGFPLWAADLQKTGWYGFPVKPDGTLKVANHGPGRRIHPDEPRAVDPGDEAWFREFLAGTFPSLASAPLIGSRLCLYCDTWDGNFFIDRDPDRPGLVVATGGSGHGFKFAPVIGDIIADVAVGKPNRWSHRFAWRRRGEITTEDARHT